MLLAVFVKWENMMILLQINVNSVINYKITMGIVKNVLKIVVPNASNHKNFFIYLFIIIIYIYDTFKKYLDIIEILTIIVNVLLL